MVRGLPYSILLHVLGMVLVILYGNFVARNPVQPPQSIPFRMVYESPRQPDRERAATPEESPPETVEQETPPDTERPEAVPDLPPKEVPEEKPVVEDDPEPEAVDSRVKEDPQPRGEDPSDVQEEPGGTAGVTGPAVGAVDSDFPFAWYVQRMESLMAANWNPPQLNFGKRSRYVCQVHFIIARNGLVSGVTLSSSSGVGVFDREALRTAQTTRLPPLPPQYRGSSLGVTFHFTLEPNH